MFAIHFQKPLVPFDDFDFQFGMEFEHTSWAWPYFLTYYAVHDASPSQTVVESQCMEAFVDHSLNQIFQLAVLLNCLIVVTDGSNAVPAGSPFELVSVLTE